MDCSTPGLPVHHHLWELAQTHVHRVGDAIQPSHPLSAPSPPAFNLSQHQGLFQQVNSSHQVAKGLEFQLQHQSFQWIFKFDVIAKESPNRKSWRFNPLFSFKSFVYWRPLFKVFDAFVVNLEIYPCSGICGVVFSRSVVSDSLWPRGLQSPRLLCPWGFSRQAYWRGSPFPSPGDLPGPGIEPTSLALADRLFTTEPPGRFFVMYIFQ